MNYDLVGIGNAVVDVIAQVDHDFLTDYAIKKGIMQLIEKERATSLYEAMENRIQSPGGSVANTIAGANALGLKTAFIGRVRDDALGHHYAASLTEQNIDFVNKPISDNNEVTSRSMIFITPDGERSMNTYLGISTRLSADDVPKTVVQRTKLMFLEGYLFDHDAGKSAFRKAARATQKAGNKAGIAISDPFCVERHRSDFLSLIQNNLDFVIGNELEFRTLFQKNDLNEALQSASKICSLVICTKSADGVTVIANSHRIDVPTKKLVPVDVTGAGDQFAAGFLFGVARGYDIKYCAQIGHVCASEVISHIGARPQTDITTILYKKELL